MALRRARKVPFFVGDMTHMWALNDAMYLSSVKSESADPETLRKRVSTPTFSLRMEIYCRRTLDKTLTKE